MTGLRVHDRVNHASPKWGQSAGNLIADCSPSRNQPGFLQPDQMSRDKTLVSSDGIGDSVNAGHAVVRIDLSQLQSDAETGRVRQRLGSLSPCLDLLESGHGQEVNASRRISLQPFPHCPIVL